VVDRLIDHSARLKALTAPSDDPVRATQRALAPADIVRRSGGPDPRDAAMIAQHRAQRDDPAEQIRRLSRDFR